MNLQKQYGITVKEALSLDVVSRLHVVGGKEGLNRVIKLVNVIEVPDIIDWLMDGEFLLTTGYSFREYPELLTMLIPKMAERGSACLAIKTKRFLKEIPEELIKSADEHNIPLLEVPYDLSFSEIIAPVLGVIFNKQNKILQKLDQAHKKLMDIVLHGSTLDDLCNETAKLISNPVAIVDRDGELTLSAEDTDKLKFEQFFAGNAAVTEKIRGSNIREVKFSLENTAGKGETQAMKAIRIPITADTSEYGHIYAIHNNPVSEPDILILERAATIAALEFTKQKAIFEIEKNYYNEFLEILLSCDFDSVDETIKRGRIFNINLQKPTAVVIVNDTSFNGLDTMRLPMKGINGQSAKEELLKAINSYQRMQSKSKLIAGIKGTNIVLVIELSEQNPSENLRKAVSGLIKHLGETAKIKNNNIKIGVGRPYANISKIAQSYQEAREALKICQLSDASSVLHFEELGFYKILSEKSKKELEKFVDDLLLPVFEYDRNKNGELIKTLETYYDVNRNFKLTSKNLFTHYNTILYRIKKIEELTGASLSNPENSLNMEIAVNILKLLRSDKN
jgi:PucR family transcriptional regulator, purine catabolism regulatory protein